MRKEKDHAVPTGQAQDDPAPQVDSGWQVTDDRHVEREFRFNDFRGGPAVTSTAGQIAEQQGRHPNILLSWGKVRITIHTHRIDGLTGSDFVLVARIDATV